MSEIRDRVIKKLKYEILDQKFNKIATNSDGVWAGYQLTHKVIADFVDQILSIPEMAIVDREAKLPSFDVNKVVAEIKSPHWLSLGEKIGFDIIISLTQEAIRKEGWVKEVKDD